MKLIFRLFLEGLTPHAIAKELTDRGIKTPGGKDVWSQQTVRRMLSNEKYKGDALLQKSSPWISCRRSSKRTRAILSLISAKEAQSQRLADFIQTLKEQDGAITEFDARLWGLMVDYVTVGRKKEMVFTFRDGTEITA